MPTAWDAFALTEPKPDYYHLLEEVNEEHRMTAWRAAKGGHEDAQDRWARWEGRKVLPVKSRGPETTDEVRAVLAVGAAQRLDGLLVNCHGQFRRQ
jgi:hypothetical protein